MYSAAISSPREGVSRPSSRSEARNETCPRREPAEMWLVTIRISGVTRTGSAANAQPHSASASAANRTIFTGRASLLILILVEPRHLNRLQFSFVRFLGIVGKLVKLGDPFMQVG